MEDIREITSGVLYYQSEDDEDIILGNVVDVHREYMDEMIEAVDNNDCVSGSGEHYFNIALYLEETYDLYHPNDTIVKVIENPTRNGFDVVEITREELINEAKEHGWEVVE